MTLPVRRAVLRRSTGAAPGGRSPRRSEPLVPLGRVPGQERPGEGDVLELAQVAELVVDGQAPLPRPAERLGPPALRDQHPRPQRRDRPHVRGEVADVEALRLVEQLERAVAGRPRPRGSGPSRPASGSGSAAGRRARPARCSPGRCRRAASRSSRSRSSWLRPTCMSAAPRSTRLGLLGALQSPLVDAHRLAEAALREPHVGQRDGAAEHVGVVPGPLQARHGVGVPAGCAASRSPLVQYASPRRAAGAPRARWSSSPARSSARRACVIVPATSPRTRAVSGAVHRDRGRERAERLLVDDDHLAAPGRLVGSSHRSASRSRSSTPSSSPRAMSDADVRRWSAPAGPGTARRAAPRASAAAWPPAAPGAAPGSRARPGPPPARSPRAASAWWIASDRSPFCSYQSLARRCSSADARRAARPAGARAARRRRGGGSGTTGGGRRAGPGTGSPDRGPPAWPCRRPGR